MKGTGVAVQKGGRRGFGHHSSPTGHGPAPLQCDSDGCCRQPPILAHRPRHTHSTTPTTLCPRDLLLSIAAWAPGRRPAPAVPTLTIDTTIQLYNHPLPACPARRRPRHCCMFVSLYRCHRTADGRDATDRRARGGSRRAERPGPGAPEPGLLQGGRICLLLLLLLLFIWIEQQQQQQAVLLS